MDRTTSRSARPAFASSSTGLPLADALREHLPDELIDQALADENVVLRDSFFTPAVILWTFLTQVFHVGASCRSALIRLFAGRFSTSDDFGGGDCPTSTGGFCKARQRLPEPVYRQIVRLVAQRASRAAGDSGWDWKGHSVKVVDGTSVSMPDTPANQAEYPQQKNQKRGVGFPLARMLLWLDLASGCAQSFAMAAWAGKGRGEGSLLARHLPGEIQPGEVVLGDCNFSVYWLLASLVASGAHYVGVLSRTRRADYRKGRRLGKTDHVVVWRKPTHKQPAMTQQEWDALPPTLEVRRMRVRVARRGCRTKTLEIVTTLLDALAYAKDDVAELYRRRWQIELHLRSLKSGMKMGVLRCKSPAMVRREVAMHLLVFDVVRSVMVSAAGKKRAPWRLSFTAAREAVEAFATRLPSLSPLTRASALEAMRGRIAKEEVDERPGRSEPRVLKRRPKDCKFMTKPRDQYPRNTKTCA